MAPPLAGHGQATYVLQHALVQRPMAVTMGHKLQTGEDDYVREANDLHRLFAEAMMPSFDSNVTLSYVDLLIGTLDDDPSGSVRSTYAPVAGGASMNSLPANVSVLVTKLTATLGRKGRGRLFLPFFVPESSVDEGGTIDANVMDDLQGSVGTWFTDLLAGGSDVLGPYPPGLNSSNGPGPLQRQFRPLIGMTVQNKVATQRRRLRR